MVMVAIDTTDMSSAEVAKQKAQAGYVNSIEILFGDFSAAMMLGKNDEAKEIFTQLLKPCPDHNSGVPRMTSLLCLDTRKAVLASIIAFSKIDVEMAAEALLQNDAFGLNMMGWHEPLFPDFMLVIERAAPLTQYKILSHKGPGKDCNWAERLAQGIGNDYSPEERQLLEADGRKLLEPWKSPKALTLLNNASAILDSTGTGGSVTAPKEQREHHNSGKPPIARFSGLIP